MTLRGVLLDAGDTMIGPRGGRWNPRFDFEDIVGRHAPQARMELLADAIDAGRRYMTDASAAAAWDRDAYHRVVLTVLGVEEPSIGLLAELDAPMPFVEMVEVFPDVRPTLDALKARRVPVAVVSEPLAWRPCTGSSGLTATSTCSSSPLYSAAERPIPACTEPAAKGLDCGRRSACSSMTTLTWCRLRSVSATKGASCVAMDENRRARFLGSAHSLRSWTCSDSRGPNGAVR